MKQLTKILLLFIIFCSCRFAHAQTIPTWQLKDLQSAIANAKQPTIFNFWATFCKPCIAELPHFQALTDQYKNEGVNLIMVSLDVKEAFPKTVNSFVKRLKLTSPVVFLDESNADLFCPVVDSSWSGAIPASLFVNPQTGYRKFYEEELSKEKLEVEIKRMLGKQ